MNMKTRRIKIAMIIPDLNFGGAQTMVIRLIHAIDVSKFEVKLFIRDSKLGNSLEKEAEEKGIECIYLNLGENEKHNLLLVHKCKAYARLSKALKIFDPDLIHSHLEQFYSFLFSIHHGVPLVHTLHSMPERIYTKRLNIMIKALQNKNHLRIVGCSKKTSQKAQELFRLKETSITTIYNPICLSDYKYEEKQATEFIFIHVARLHPVKNQELLLRAFRRIEDENVKLWIVGEELKLDNRVVFMGNRGDVPQLLSQANAFILSSNSEACPMTVLEALASGLPVVSTDVGGIRELVGECGILVEPQNEDELFKAMQEIRKPEIYSVIANKSAIQRASLFKDDVIARQYEEVYIDMIENNTFMA